MRRAKQERKTKETEISIDLDLDGTGAASIDVPIGFLRHMLETFSHYSLIDLTIRAKGDLDVDQHHLIEDLGLTLGETIHRALGDKRGVYRTSSFTFPMDDARTTVTIDLSGRPHLSYHAIFDNRDLDDTMTTLFFDFFQALTMRLQATVHIDMFPQGNDHHRAESMFKAFGRALRHALEIDPRRSTAIPSTKGVI